jgi:PAS domain S-box-containing protein
MKTKSFTILNVDDSVEYLRTHSHFLKSEGYKVLEATTGNECLRLTKKHKPDLILLDVVLPDIYGTEVCRQIKTNVDTKQTLILLISGYEIGSDAQVQGFEAGADDYLVKPISKDELLAHVRVMERIKRSEDELREAALLLEQRVKERTKALEKTNQELQNEIAGHKRAEEALCKTEKKFRLLFEQNLVGVYHTTLEGDILDCNDAFINMLGYDSLEELRAHKAVDFYSTETARNNFVSCLRTEGFVKNSEISLSQKNGTALFGLENATLITEVEDTPSTILGTIVDITERKRAEEALNESEERFRRLFIASPDAIMLLDTSDPSGCWPIVDCNDIACQMNGYTREELIGKSVDILNISVGTLEERAAYLDRIRREGVIRLETFHRHRDGHIFPIEVSTSIVIFKGRELILGIDRDITERKRAEEALQESELRFRSLYENATIGIYRTTPDGNILLANLALVKMLGYTAFQKLAERNLEKDGFEPSSQRKEFLEKIERDGEVHGYDSKWIRQDGATIFVLESARAIRDSQGKTLYYDGTVEDITKRMLLEEQMRQMQKLEGLGTLAGGIAHDFNNILGIILAYITSTKKFKDDTKKLDLAVDTIVKAVERGKTLVQQILTFARKTETEFRVVNVNDVVMEIMTMIFETFPKVLTYAQNFDKAVPSINADRSQLYQVLLNLCVNARDAMPNGGLLTINTHMVSGISLRIQYPDAAASSYVCIEVCDTGEGMSEETQKRIFEPFFTTKEQGKGTGLGLAVVFGVVQTHKGFIDVESELGKGTTFRLYLPALQVAAPINVKDEEMLEEISGGTETLLVVEDEEMLMMSLQMVLVEKGYNVLSAGDGLTALKIYQERKSDIALVLTDLGLPNMTGMEVCQRIKKINPNERMVVATGYLDPEMKSEFLKARIQHFLYKPYDLKQVLKVVREVLDGK